MKDLLRKEWWKCQKCGLEIGLLGRFIEKIFPFKPFVHKCSDTFHSPSCDIFSSKYDNFEFYLKSAFNKILTFSSITHGSEQFNFLPKRLFFTFKVDKDDYDFDGNVNKTAMPLKIGLEKEVIKNIYKQSYRLEAHSYKNFLAILDDINETMNKLGVPTYGRYIIIPARFGTVIKEADIQYPVFGSNCENGFVGFAKKTGIRIMLNNNLDQDRQIYKCIAGHESAITMNYENSGVNMCRAVIRKDIYQLRGYVEYNFEIVRPEWLFTIPVMVD